MLRLKFLSGRAGSGAEASSPAKEEIRCKWTVYPFLFSLYPVLFLYLRNIREVQLGQVFWAASVSLGITLCGWFFTGTVSKRRSQRTLVLFLFLILFHFYGLYYDQISGLLPQNSRLFQAHLLAFILPGTIWLVSTILVLRSRRNFSSLNRVLQTTVWLLLLWNIGGITIHHGESLVGHSQRGRSVDRILPALPAWTPDIYCFILDEFAGPESIRRLFGYDGSAFIASLRRQGFFVAERSRGLFALTEPSIAAILNLDETSCSRNPHTQVRRNAVAEFLKKRGYRIIEFACLPTLFLEMADQRFYYDLAHASIFFDDFYRALFERSLLRILPDLWKQKKSDLTRFYRQRVLQVFNELPGIVKGPGPKFVYVHLFSPHEPFVFNVEGRLSDPEHIWDHASPQYYLQQYAYISRRMAETAAMIIRESSMPPVIVIQSDHGYRGSRHPGSKFPPQEMRSVFNALYLPGVSPDKIAPSLSPRNNFRLVFNLYFGAAYPLAANP